MYRYIYLSMYLLTVCANIHTDMMVPYIVNNAKGCEFRGLLTAKSQNHWIQTENCSFQPWHDKWTEATLPHFRTCDQSCGRNGRCKSGRDILVLFSQSQNMRDWERAPKGYTSLPFDRRGIRLGVLGKGTTSQNIWFNDRTRRIMGCNPVQVAENSELKGKTSRKSHPKSNAQ